MLQNVAHHCDWVHLTSAHWKMLTRCINLSTTREATFLAESASSCYQATSKVLQAEAALLKRICWFLLSIWHTICSWLISFCLVWRATKACSCSICSCCFSSTASCICWGEKEKGRGCGYSEGFHLKMIFELSLKEMPNHNLSPLLATEYD